MTLAAAKVSSLIFGRRSEPTHVGCYEGSFMVPMRFKKEMEAQQLNGRPAKASPMRRHARSGI